LNVLAVETSTELCSAALLRDGELFVEEALAENRHSELLAPMARRLLTRARMEPRHVDAFAFGQGPGSFTGLRIACGFVQGLAFGAGRPVVPIPSLLALAAQAGESCVVAAMDARMGEAYLAAYARQGEDWDEVIAPCLVDAPALEARDRLPGRQWVAIGSGFGRHPWLEAHFGASIVHCIAGDLPRARAVARLAAIRLGRGLAIAPEQAAPLYLRDKVALTTLERLARK
jgi:tRNA threonylcarbamoyladenosine biosynthesis protein TsaB